MASVRLTGILHSIVHTNPLRSGCRQSALNTLDSMPGTIECRSDASDRGLGSFPSPQQSCPPPLKTATLRTVTYATPCWPQVATRVRIWTSNLSNTHSAVLSLDPTICNLASSLRRLGTMKIMVLTLDSSLLVGSEGSCQQRGPACSSQSLRLGIM